MIKKVLLNYFVIFLIVSLTSCGNSKNVKWSFRFKEKMYKNRSGFSMPAIGENGIVYFSGNGIMYAINMHNGKLQWKKDKMGYIGSNSIVSKDRKIYCNVLKNDSFKSILISLNFDGSINWEQKIKFNVNNIVLDNFGYIYAGTCIFANAPGKVTNGGIYVFNSEGILQWKNEKLDGILGSGLSFDNESNIYICADSNLISMNKETGKINWEFNSGNKVKAGPTMISDSLIYFGNETGLIALNKDGEEKWNYRYDLSDNGYMGDALEIVNDDLVCFKIDSIVYAIDKEGNEKWTYKSDDTIWGNPVNYQNKYILFTTQLSSKLIVLNQDGSLEREIKFRQNLLERFASTPVVDHQGNIYITTSKRLYALKRL